MCTVVFGFFRLCLSRQRARKCGPDGGTQSLVAKQKPTQGYQQRARNCGLRPQRLTEIRVIIAAFEQELASSLGRGYS